MRVVILILGLLVASCHRADSWRDLNIRAGDSRFDSKKLIYPAVEFLRDMELEFLCVSGELQAYLNVYAGFAPSDRENTQMSLLVLQAGTETYEMSVERLAGGQRLKIPKTSLDFFIELLERNSLVILSLGNLYKTKVYTKYFSSHLKALKTKSLFFIPSDPVGLAL